MKNSGVSPRFEWWEFSAVAGFLIVLAAASSGYCFSRGYILYYGDAQAHLNISRSILDSRTPGYDQLGTVWLPILHIICLPFVLHTSLWHSGLAGTIPVEACFLISGIFLYLSARETFSSRTGAAVCMGCFALNPNVLYLASIPMTEIVFTAGAAVCLWAILRFRRTQRAGLAAMAVCSSWWMSLTRYDGWFLIPFIALFLGAAAEKRKVEVFLWTGAMSALAPLYWMGHNWRETGNFLDFYNGPYSAMAIQGHRAYPGYHDWPQAVHYYFEAGRFCAGDVLIILGLAGLALTLWRGPRIAIWFLGLTPVFYVWSLHSSSTPIHLPTLYPFSYYNSRYGLGVAVLMAFAASAIVTAIPFDRRRLGLLIPLLAISPWILAPNKNDWICWKESQQNSIARRAWTTLGANFLKAHFLDGDGVLLESGTGDISGILCKAEIPLREAIDIGNGPLYFANTLRTGLVRQAKWALAQEGDELSKRLAASQAYEIRQVIRVEGAPLLLICQRRRPPLKPTQP